MIVEYFRPASLQEALALLQRPDPLSVPLGGGTALNRPSETRLAAVDLQNLGLDQVEVRGNLVHLGATLTLQKLADTPGLPSALILATNHEATYNLRQVATVAGSLVASDGLSPFACAMLALDADLKVLKSGGAEAAVSLALGEFLPGRSFIGFSGLILEVSIPLNIRLAYEQVARTPQDKPLLCTSLAQWPSGRTRISLGGFGPSVVLALDGPEPGGAQAAVRSALAHSGDDWASAEYRQETAAILVERMLSEAV